MSERLSKGDLVLVSGSAGLIGSAIADELLKRGFRVRGVTRDASKEQLLKDKFDQIYGKDAFQWSEVPDATKTGAYRQALQGVSGIIHTATDVSFTPDFEKVVQGSVQMTVNILQEAKQVPTVKSVVVTSSRNAAYSARYGPEISVSLKDFNNRAVELAQTLPQDNPLKSRVVYAASKTRAEQEVWRFVEEEKPSFVVNVVLPEAVVGPANVNPAKRVYSTSTWTKEVFDGNTNGFGVSFFNPPGFVVDVRDVAVIHVAALVASDVQSERLWASGHSIHINEVLAIWRKHYPDNHRIPADFDFPPAPKINIDKSRSTELLQRYAGRSYVPAEESFLATVA